MAPRYYLAMGTVTLGARTLLGVLFAVAALTKLSSPSAVVETFEGFGLPRRLTRVGSLALAPTELVLAAGLLIAPTARWAAIGAALLLIVFIAGITNALRQGRTPDCGCFGAFRPTPIGRSTLARNGLLLIITLPVILRGPGPALDHWVSTETTAGLLASLAVVLVALGGLMYASFPRAPGQSTAPVSDAPKLIIGQPVPSFELSDAQAGPQRLASLLTPGLPLMMVFGSPTCGPCRDLYPHLARWESTLGERLQIALVLGGDLDQARTVAQDHGLTQVLSDPAASVSRSYGIAATPSALVLATDATLVGGPAMGADAIEDLVRSTLHRHAPMSQAWIETTHAA